MGRRKWGFRGGLEGMSGWLDGDREPTKDLPEDDEQLGGKPRGPAWTPLTHSSQAAH